MLVISTFSRIKKNYRDERRPRDFMSLLTMASKEIEELPYKVFCILVF